MGYSPALDGLRGIAILLVFAHHLTIIRPASTFDGQLLEWLHLGWAGVDLFFVLSGYLITGILLDARDSPRYFSSFYARRALRIVPLYYLIIFVSYHVLPHFPWWYQRLVGVGFVPPEWEFWLFVSNITMAARDQLSHGILGVSWSLAIEEQFYIVWALVVWLCRPQWLGGLCAAIIALAPILRAAAIANGASEMEVYMQTPLRADALAAGGGLAWLARHAPAFPIGRAAPYAAVAGLGGVAGLAWWDGHHSWESGLKQFIGYTFLALAGCGMLLGAVHGDARGPWVRFLSSPLLRRFGHYSYCLYLTHLPVMWTVRYTVFDPTLVMPIGGSNMPQQLLFAAIVTPLTLAVGWLSWTVVEAPLLRLKRHFPY